MITEDAIVGTIADLVFELDHRGVLTRVGGQLGATGLGAGRNIADVAPDAARQVMDAARTARETAVAQRLAFTLGGRELEAAVARRSDSSVIVLARDVTAEREARRRLLESEARFRTMADGAPVLLWMAGLDMGCEFFNRQWLEFTGRPIEKELGTGWAGGVHFEDFQRCMRVYADSFVARRPFRMEYRLRRADGEYRWLLDTGLPRIGPDGRFEGYIGSCVDITEIREAHEGLARMSRELEQRVEDRTAALARALSERELLLREMHHRVKNNLQLVSSLMGLKARTEAEGVSRVLKEMQDRVRSIALLHEKLHQSGALGRVAMRGYLSDLAKLVVAPLGADRVTLSVEAADVELLADQAIPCGLIVNELVANAMEHAFVDRPGAIAILFATLEDGRVELVVADDGAGLPPGLEPERGSSFGLQLVSTLAAQLDAQLAFERASGTRVRLRFSPRDG